MVCGLSLDAPHDAAAKQFNRQGRKEILFFKKQGSWRPWRLCGSIVGVSCSLATSHERRTAFCIAGGRGSRPTSIQTKWNLPAAAHEP
jgi:hypothetical protein